MNKTIGIGMLISGLFFALCGMLTITHAGTSGMAAVSVDTALFVGGGLALLVAGLLLVNNVHLSPPGSLMVRRGEK